jgi:hypothetical protein
MREVGLVVQESEPHMSESFDQAQVIQTTQTESQEDMGMLVGVASTSGISTPSSTNTPGAVAGMAEQRKAVSYSRLWNLESERAKLIFFGIELSGCLAQRRNTFASRWQESEAKVQRD